MDLFILTTGVTDLSASAITSASNVTPLVPPTGLPQLVLGTTEPITVKFLTAASTYETWSDDPAYDVIVSLGLITSDGLEDYVQTELATVITEGKSGSLQLTSDKLIAAVEAAFGRNLHASTVEFVLQINVTAPVGSMRCFAMLPVTVWGRVPSFTPSDPVFTPRTLGAGVADWLETPSSANLRAALTDETGTGAAVFANTPTLVTPNIGAATGTSLNLSAGLTCGNDATINGVTVGHGNLDLDTSTAFGYQALKVDAGGSNAAFGYQALKANTSGNSNTAVGAASLQANTTGLQNTAVGIDSLYSNTSGQSNTAVGNNALGYNESGSFNVGVGEFAGFRGTSPSYTTAIGHHALEENVTLSGNTAVGKDALNKLTDGAGYCTAVGAFALAAGTGGSENSAFGFLSMGSGVVTAGFNCAFGAYGLYSLTGGDSNCILGYQAGYSVTTGSKNIAIGRAAMASNATGNGNLCLGYYAGYYETGSDAFYVNNRNRVNTAGDKALSLLYGTFADTAAAQTLTINAVLTLLGGEVTYGANDSAGTGFRTMKVPNA
jgi:hypothetical protein